VLVGASIGGGDETPLWSYRKLQLLQEMDEPLIRPVAGFAGRTLRLQHGDESLPLRAELVSQSYLPMLGARTSIGRLFSPEEDDPASPVIAAVISHAFWLRAFGGDPSVLGRTYAVGANELRVVGVADPSFEGLTGEVDAWLPITSTALLFSPSWIQEPSFALFQVVGRLAPGVSLGEGRSWADAAVRHVWETFPHPLDDREVAGRILPLREGRVRPEARAAVLVMAGAALMVLLIGCANLAGMLIARAAARRHEVAVRIALGAGRSRVLRQLLVESSTLALIGGGAGVLVAHYGVALLRTHWPARFAADPTGWLRTFGELHEVFAAGAVVSRYLDERRPPSGQRRLLRDARDAAPRRQGILLRGSRLG
jgi:putative ABC transport system permease protein